MNKLHRLGIPFLVAALGLGLLVDTANDATIPSLTVSFGRLSFSWPADARALYSRLERFAEDLCALGNAMRLSGMSCRPPPLGAG